MSGTDARRLASFEQLQLSPASFSHRDHVLVAREMLATYSFPETVWRYSKTIHTMATAAGAPKKFNVTVTLAFLSLIAERMDANPKLTGDDFLSQNPDLLSTALLNNWYSSEELHSEFARNQFLLPRVRATDCCEGRPRPATTSR